MVLDLARPSEPWCFAAGSCFFRSWFTGISSSSRRHQSCEQPQATESLDNRQMLFFYAVSILFFCYFSSTFFLAFQRTRLGSFLAWFWNVLVLRSHGVLLPGAAFFEAIVSASAAAAATCEQLQTTDSLEKSCFSRISDDTLDNVR